MPWRRRAARSGRPLRIAHVTDCYLPRLGGIEWQVHDLAERQRAQGHEVEIVTSVPGAHEPDGLLVHRPDGGGRDGAIRYVTSPRGRNVVLSRGYDVVHAHVSTFSPLATLTARAASRAGIPTLVTVHSMWSYATPLFRASERLAGWGRWPVAWSAVSGVVADTLRPLLAPGAPVAVLPNAIDREHWLIEPARRDPSQLTVVSTMRFAPRKRPLAMLRVLRAVRAALPGDVRLRAVLIGDGPQRARTERYVRRHDMRDWVEMPGRWSRDRIREEFAHADLYVAPAELESFGIAALEARSAGLPVVGRTGTGLSEFVAHGREGLLVASDADMVDAVLGLATESSVREAIARHNRSHAPSITWESVLQTAEHLYDVAAAVRVPARARLRPVSGAVGT